MIVMEILSNATKKKERKKNKAVGFKESSITRHKHQNRQETVTSRKRSDRDTAGSGQHRQHLNQL